MDNVSGVLIRFKDQFLTFTNVPGIKDRKSTTLKSSHITKTYDVICLKKKK